MQIWNANQVAATRTICIFYLEVPEVQLDLYQVLGKCLCSNTAVKAQAHWISINVPLNTETEYLSILHFLNSVLQKEVIQNPIFKVANTINMSWQKKYGMTSKTLPISPKLYEAIQTSRPRRVLAHVLGIHQISRSKSYTYIRYSAL